MVNSVLFLNEKCVVRNEATSLSQFEQILIHVYETDAIQTTLCSCFDRLNLISSYFRLIPD